MTHAEDIKRMLDEAGMEEVSFLYRRSKPTIQKNGYRYEILSIYEDDGCVYLDGIQVYPSYRFAIEVLKMDGSWREVSLRRVRDIVERETYRYINI